jgi:hypothetical protein
MDLTAARGRLRLSHKRTGDANAVRRSHLAAGCIGSHVASDVRKFPSRLNYRAGQFCDR